MVEHCTQLTIKLFSIPKQKQPPLKWKHSIKTFAINCARQTDDIVNNKKLKPAYGKRVQSVNSQIRREIRVKHLKKARLFNYVSFTDDFSHKMRPDFIWEWLAKATFHLRWMIPRRNRSIYFSECRHNENNIQFYFPMKKSCYKINAFDVENEVALYFAIKYERIIISTLDSASSRFLISFPFILFVCIPHQQWKWKFCIDKHTTETKPQPKRLKCEHHVCIFVAMDRLPFLFSLVHICLLLFLWLGAVQKNGIKVDIQNIFWGKWKNESNKMFEYNDIYNSRATRHRNSERAKRQTYKEKKDKQQMLRTWYEYNKLLNLANILHNTQS